LLNYCRNLSKPRFSKWSG